jgi:urea-proton symporter
MGTTPPLSQATGYGVVIGLGFLFAFGMMLTTFVLRRYNNELQTSEVFNTAGRTVKSGLVASAVVSSWTWAATLLQSSAVAYKYGVSGGFWYVSQYSGLEVHHLMVLGTPREQLCKCCYLRHWPLS